MELNGKKELFGNLNKFLEAQKALSDEIIELEIEMGCLREKIANKSQEQHRLGCDFVRDTGLTTSYLSNKFNQQIYRDENGNFYRIEVSCCPHKFYDCYFSFKPLEFFGPKNDPNDIESADYL